MKSGMPMAAAVIQSAVDRDARNVKQQADGSADECDDGDREHENDLRREIDRHVADHQGDELQKSVERELPGLVTDELEEAVEGFAEGGVLERERGHDEVVGEGGDAAEEQEAGEHDEVAGEHGHEEFRAGRLIGPLCHAPGRWG